MNDVQRIMVLLEDTAMADGFVGLTDEEWRGAQKFIGIFLQTLPHLLPEAKYDKLHGY